MALFRGIPENVALDVNNIARVEDSGNIVSILVKISLYPPQGPLILYNYLLATVENLNQICKNHTNMIFILLTYQI